MEFELTVDGNIAESPSVEHLEHCGQCGTPVQLVCVIALVRLLAGLPEPADAPKTWMEHRTVVDSQQGSLQMRPHTPERCQLVRAGTPEPWDDPATWDDDEDDG